MPYIILFVLVIAIVIVVIRQQKFNHKQQSNGEFSNKADDIYVNGYEEKDDSEYNF